jgi:hypothetical protein
MRLLHSRGSAALSLLLLMGAGNRAPLHSQSNDAASPPARFCWRGGPSDRCDRFVVFESSVLQPVLKSHTTPDRALGYSRHADFRTRGVLSLGWLQNVDERHARGLVLSLGGDGETYIPSLEWRHRTWLGRGRSSRDLSAGYTEKDVFVRRGGPGGGEVARARGATAAVALTVRELIGVSARAELLSSGKHRHGAVSLGVHSAGYGTAAVGAAGVLYLALLIVAFASADY